MMKFELEVEVDAKRNTRKILNRVIERASDGVMKDKQVKMVSVKGKIVEDEDE